MRTDDPVTDLTSIHSDEMRSCFRIDRKRFLQLKPLRREFAESAESFIEVSVGEVDHETVISGELDGFEVSVPDLVLQSRRHAIRIRVDHSADHERATVLDLLQARDYIFRSDCCARRAELALGRKFNAIRIRNTAPACRIFRADVIFIRDEDHGESRVLPKKPLIARFRKALSLQPEQQASQCHLAAIGFTFRGLPAELVLELCPHITARAVDRRQGPGL